MSGQRHVPEHEPAGRPADEKRLFVAWWLHDGHHTRLRASAHGGKLMALVARSGASLLSLSLSFVPVSPLIFLLLLLLLLFLLLSGIAL